ncbi:MerR family transcriptional regulator [Aeromicrobium sp.]|uniref:MerR family transcriptional regulator n=1 Tax=Aeromicrobium sp. TaxID=1871063 RepID=UPI0028A6DE8E|nr:MerR family transcriptional regulator [Aeromicrobium sp.]
MHRRWTVGALSTMLGIAAPTLRTWERRYGVGPTFRTAGGHRRYTIVDADRVALMARLIESGVAPSEAAERVKRMSPHEVASAVGAGIEGLRASAHDYAMTGILSGAREFDGPAVQEAAEHALAQFGIEDAWDSTIAPALIEVGLHWEDGRLGVAAEHLVSSRLLSALRSIAHDFSVTGSPRVVLASAEDDQHKLPIVALGAALASHGHPVTELGSRLPLDSLEAFVESTDPAVVFLWSSVISPEADQLERLRQLGERTRLLLGGSGWPTEVVTSHSLRQAVEQVREALGDELP